MVIPESVTLSGPLAVGLALLVVAAILILAWALARAWRLLADAARGAEGRMRADVDEALSRASEAESRSAELARMGESALALMRTASRADSLSEAAAAVERALGEASGSGCRVCVLSDDGTTLTWIADGGGEVHAHQGACGYALHSRKPVELGSDPTSSIPVTAEERARLLGSDPSPLLLLPLVAEEPQGVAVLRRAPGGDGAAAQMLAQAAAVALSVARERERLHVTVRELHEQAEASETREQDLRRSLQAKDEFLATVAHELRTPLNAIVGWGHILKARANDVATRDKAIDAVIRNGDRQARLIADLLDLSRVAAGKLQLDVQPAVELTGVVRGALETVRPLADGKGVQLRSTIDAEAGPVGADPHRLQQVVWNLLVNALKFTPAGGEVAVEVARDDAGVQIRVVDSGPGVPEELLPSIFDPFRQGAGSARTHGGLGLGLAIVRHLVELHGGRVEVRNNTSGTGATFFVTLPSVPPSTQAAGTAIGGAGLSVEDLPSLGNVRALVVARDNDAREIVASILRAQGAEVTGAGSVREALDAVKASEPDIVLATPGIDEDGDLIRQLRAMPAEAGGTVLAVALTIRREERVRALLAGFQGHVPMPPEPSELVALVAALTEHARVPEAV